MSLRIEGSFEESLFKKLPTTFGGQTIRPPHGALGDIRVVPAMTIPPLNTDIQFVGTIPTFDLAEHPGLADISPEAIPEEFNWRDEHFSDSPEIKKKKRLITPPGNQALCGSCWAIAGAGMVSDNFVVSGQVDWFPNISTTWSLACYPQNQCKGGNPAKLFQDVAEGGMVSNHCIDYSWCLTNDNCNGKATKHFDHNKAAAQHAVMDLSALIPSCGCYDKDAEHYLYMIDKHPKSIHIGAPGVTKENIAITVKKHVYLNGPALGGFLVFKNFMKGEFAKMNGGVYLERGIYDQDGVRFSDDQVAAQNYKGAHAVVIVGWGVEKNILVDNGGKRADVPYWFVRNSWTTKWGDGGYFKMAMYPWNKMSQFEKTVDLDTGLGLVRSGGIVFISVSKPPVKQKIRQAVSRSTKRIHDAAYYASDPKYIPQEKKQGGSSSKWLPRVLYFVLPMLAMCLLIWLVWFRKGRQTRRR